MPDILHSLEKTCKKYLKAWAPNGVAPCKFFAAASLGTQNTDQNELLEDFVSIAVSSSAKRNTKLTMHLDLPTHMNEYGICTISDTGEFKLLNANKIVLDVDDSVLSAIEKILKETNQFYEFYSDPCCQNVATAFLNGDSVLWWDSMNKSWRLDHNLPAISLCPWCQSALPRLHLKEKVERTFGRFSAIAEKVKHA